MNFIEQLQESRKLAGLNPLTNEAVVELAEKKLSGAEKDDFLAKMGKGGSAKTKKDKEVDDGKPGPTKDARKAMKDADIKGSTTKKGKKKVSEQISAVLEGAGLEALTEEAAAKVDAAYPETEDDAE